MKNFHQSVYILSTLENGKGHRKGTGEGIKRTHVRDSDKISYFDISVDSNHLFILCNLVNLITVGISSTLFN
jgi:hypothetical protein